MSTLNALMQVVNLQGYYRPMNPPGTRPEPPEVRCSDGERFLLLTGSGITGGSGQWELNVRRVICPGSKLGEIQDVTMVATPTFDPSSKILEPPRFISTAWAGSLTLYVRMHEQSGAPAPNARFDWHALILHHGEPQPGPDTGTDA